MDIAKILEQTVKSTEQSRRQHILQAGQELPSANEAMEQLCRVTKSIGQELGCADTVAFVVESGMKFAKEGDHDFKQALRKQLRELPDHPLLLMTLMKFAQAVTAYRRLLTISRKTEADVIVKTDECYLTGVAITCAVRGERAARELLERADSMPWKGMQLHWLDTHSNMTTLAPLPAGHCYAVVGSAKHPHDETKTLYMAAVAPWPCLDRNGGFDPKWSSLCYEA